MRKGKLLEGVSTTAIYFEERYLHVDEGVEDFGYSSNWEELSPSFIAPPRFPPRTALAAVDSPQPRTAKRVILAPDSEDEQPAPIGRAVPSAVTLPSVRNAESAKSLEPDSKVRNLASRLPRTSTTSSMPSLIKVVQDRVVYSMPTLRFFKVTEKVQPDPLPTTVLYQEPRPEANHWEAEIKLHLAL